METVISIRDAIAGQPGSNLQTLHKFLSTVLLVITGFYLLRYVNESYNVSRRDFLSSREFYLWRDLFGTTLLNGFLVLVHLIILFQIWSSSTPGMVFNNLVFVLFLMITSILGVALFEFTIEDGIPRSIFEIDESDADKKLKNYVVFAFLTFIASLYSLLIPVTGCWSVGLAFLLLIRGLEIVQVRGLQPMAAPAVPVSTRAALSRRTRR